MMIATLHGPGEFGQACPAGTFWDPATKTCVPSGVPAGPSPSVCPGGMVWDSSIKRCVCPGGQVWSSFYRACVWPAPPRAFPAAAIAPRRVFWR